MRSPDSPALPVADGVARAMADGENTLQTSDYSGTQHAGMPNSEPKPPAKPRPMAIMAKLYPGAFAMAAASNSPKGLVMRSRKLADPNAPRDRVDSTVNEPPTR